MMYYMQTARIFP